MITATVPETRRPTSLAEACEAVKAGGTMLFTGGGTKLDWGTAGAPVDALVSTSGLNRILAHNAADATISVEAGTPLSSVQEQLSVAGQWLPVDPGGDDATLGGIFATDDAGPLRLAFGTLRDLVIGVTVVLADGTAARSGGFVIKNVAGYDLGRLLCGSFGTLALVAAINLKVGPRPETMLTVRAPASVQAALQGASAVSDAALEPVAADYADDALYLRFAGRAAAVHAQVERAGDLLRLDSDILAGEGEASHWRRLASGLSGREGETVVRVGTLPAHLPQVAEAVAACAEHAGVTAHLSSHLLVGAHTVRISGANPAVVADVIIALRQRLGRLAPVPGYAVVRRHPVALEAHVDPWGPPPSGVGLMRAVKNQLDPERRCAPGRFVGGI